MIVNTYISDIGAKRQTNEDSYIIDNQNNFVIVSDGMGGHERGDIASKYVVSMFNKYLLEYSTINNDDKVDYLSDISKYLKLANENSNEKIIKYSNKHNIIKTMGATVVGLYLEYKYNKIIIFHLGDSRVYRIRNENIVQLTNDHSNTSNILTKAIGNFEVFDLEIQSYDYEKNDKYLVCSDGVYNFIDTEELVNIIIGDSIKKSNQIKNIIYNNGAKDNFTLVSIGV